MRWIGIFYDCAPKSFANFAAGISGNLDTGATIRVTGVDIEGEDVDYVFIATLSSNDTVLRMIGQKGEVAGEETVYQKKE